MVLITLAFVIVFAAVHLGIGRLKFLSNAPRSAWLSAAGGVAVAYVFLHVLPELAAHRATFADELRASESMAEALVYTVSFAGLVIFYGLERAVKTARRSGAADAGHGAGRGAGVFWIHIASFAVYNLIIGYLLLHREETGLTPLLIYGVAMAVHFVTSDFGLREDHQARYDRVGRWIIAGGVIGGWLLGLAVALPDLWIGALFAFLAGGVILNVLKEELPEERESNFGAFLAGAVSYAALLWAI
ncbi:MAG: hypothetical protein ACU0AT_03130 [Tranquillimonas sp.]